MRVRLTRNLDKDRGFVNGNSGIIETMLTKDTFVLLTKQGNRILVHPVTDRGETFAPDRVQPFFLVFTNSYMLIFCPDLVAGYPYFAAGPLSTIYCLLFVG
jgi:hypothetical protein